MKNKKTTKTKIVRGLYYPHPGFFISSLEKDLVKFRVGKDCILPLAVEKDLELIKEKIKNNFYDSPFVLEKTVESILNLEDLFAA